MLPKVPSTIGGRVPDTREATRDLWGGEGVEAVMRMLDPAQRVLFAGGATSDWVPETTYMAWTRGVWDGPAARDPDALARWVDRLTDRGFGTARRMIMSLASPWVIVRRAGALWRTEHSHGELTVVPHDKHSARFELRDHPFAGDDVAAHAVSEAFRYILFRCRVRTATEQHERTADGALFVELRWS
ncbi:MAG: hypothetical protein ABI591_10045 [Kofleriaceae bacterium]